MVPGSACAPDRSAEVQVMTQAAAAGILPAVLMQVRKKVAADGAAAAIGYCNVSVGAAVGAAKKQTLAELQRKHALRDFKVRRASDRPRNPANTVDADERAALVRWTEDLKQGREPEAIVLRDGDTYTGLAPIRIGHAQCLACHGTKEVADPQALAAVAKLYPKDQATGYKLGDLRGVFRFEPEW